MWTRFGEGQSLLGISQSLTLSLSGVYGVVQACGGVRSPERLALHHIVSDVVDWDRSTAMNAPGQSGSPGSPHFSDLAARWAAGEFVTLPFTESAVHAATASTLTLTIRR